ncbi:MAG TPA: septal ring lytic transglycosylase RlpA family protein [Longimicrobiales bacterium]|nr:septal ring lytic transglycosylase RlpA family protein [Longimicrobiales bacterium]
MSPRVTRWTALQLALVASGCTLVGYPAPEPPAPAGPAAPGASRAPDPEPAAEPLSPWGNPESYEVGGVLYHVLPSADGYDETGLASWYGEEFAGRRTSSGEPFDPDRLSAAHRTLPIPTWVEVTNLENSRRLVVRVNDRGPFADTDRRIIDLSRAAAGRLGILGAGTARVRVRALSAEELGGGG